jgi:ABC-type transporter Mla maintaining outer membrane lipid asymmetry permease subunit MlaE
MVVTEEIDALRAMGLDQVEFTLAPKYLAAMITLPCLTVLSTLCGICGVRLLGDRCAVVAQLTTAPSNREAAP